MSFTVDSKLSQALSSDPDGASWTPCTSLLTWSQALCTASASDSSSDVDAVLGSMSPRDLSEDSRLSRLEQRLDAASALLGSFCVESTPMRIASTTPAPTRRMIQRVL